MVKWKKKSLPSKEKILLAAQEEFAARGFAGARMEAIARAAASTRPCSFTISPPRSNLLPRRFCREYWARFSPRSAALFNERLTPGLFMEKFPEIYIRFLARHPDLPRIMVFDLIHNPENSAPPWPADLPEDALQAAPAVRADPRWHGQGLISEADPMHFMMNIVSLSIFSFIGKPMVEAISGIKVATTRSFTASASPAWSIFSTGDAEMKKHLSSCSWASVVLPAKVTLSQAVADAWTISRGLDSQRLEEEAAAIAEQTAMRQKHFSVYFNGGYRYSSDKIAGARPPTFRSRPAPTSPREGCSSPRRTTVST